MKIEISQAELSELILQLKAVQSDNVPSNPEMDGFQQNRKTAFMREFSCLVKAISSSPPSPEWHAWHQTQMAIDYHRRVDEPGSDTVRRLARERDTANAEVKALKAEVKALKADLERQQSDAKLCIEDLARKIINA